MDFYKYGFILVIVLLIGFYTKSLLFTKHTRENGLRYRWMSSHKYYEIKGMYNCAYCGKWIPASNMEVDHIWPLHLGGKNWGVNLVPSCHKCNNHKRAKMKFAYLFLGYTYLPRFIGKVVVYSTLYVGSVITIFKYIGEILYTNLGFPSIIIGVVLGLVILKFKKFVKDIIFDRYVLTFTFILGCGIFIVNDLSKYWHENSLLTLGVILYLGLTVGNTYRHIFRLLPGDNF